MLWMVHLNKKKKIPMFFKNFWPEWMFTRIYTFLYVQFFNLIFFHFFCLLEKKIFIFLNFLFFLEPCIQCETKITLLSVSSLVVKYYTINFFYFTINQLVLYQSRPKRFCVYWWEEMESVMSENYILCPALWK